ncbi:c-type cytochrome [Benzoatithermus flavus]|uniref:C-type cytochrome n=1 Tax=Benzoatithermus flavus TaxID=3108223 RepID=A0ABU8XX76_9PROT
MGRTNACLVLALALAGLLAGAAGCPVGAQPMAPKADEGQKVFKEACAGCHKWHGGGGGGYGGAALSLRQTQLDRAHLVEVVGCGRPGTGMPSHKRDAYADGACYGLKKADLGQDAPPEANRFLRPKEIEAVVDYVIAHVQGKGDPTLADCEAFWGAGARTCGEYRPGGAAPEAAKVGE